MRQITVYRPQLLFILQQALECFPLLSLPVVRASLASVLLQELTIPRICSPKSKGLFCSLFPKSKWLFCMVLTLVPLQPCFVLLSCQRKDVSPNASSVYAAGSSHSILSLPILAGDGKGTVCVLTGRCFLRSQHEISWMWWGNYRNYADTEAMHCWLFERRKVVCTSLDFLIL